MPESEIGNEPGNNEYLYFGYGSNMSREKLRNRMTTTTSTIKFTDAWLGRVQDWELSFDQPILPPIEPVMASIERKANAVMYGVVYRLESRADWEALCETEGLGGSGGSYQVQEVPVECIDQNNPDRTMKATARTFVTCDFFKVPQWRERGIYPSARYLGSLLDGAKRENLPEHYIKQLQAIPTVRKWDPFFNHVLLMLAPIVGALMFSLVELPGSFYILWPVKKLAQYIYGWHEQVRIRDKASPLLEFRDDALCTFLRCLLVVDYALFSIPAPGLLLFSEKYRNTRANLAAALSRSSQYASPDNSKQD